MFLELEALQWIAYLDDRVVAAMAVEHLEHCR